MKTFIICSIIAFYCVFFVFNYCSGKLGKEADEHAEKLYYEHLKKLNEEGK